MDLNLEGKITVVTGGVRGIGKAIALAFAQEGAKVTVFDLDPEDSPIVEELKRSISIFKKEYLYKKTDVTDWSEVHRAIEETIRTFGKVDILINNAGGGIPPVPIEDLQEADWDRGINLNLKGAFICTHAVIKNMKAQRKGKIINIASRAGRSPSALAYLPYASGKAGVLHFTRQVAFEVASYGINVNAIAPGTIFVERIGKLWEKRSEEERRRLFESIPLKRAGKPEEIANVALFLASEKSSYITGATIDVNGGTTMM